MSLVEHVKLSSCWSTGPAPPAAGPSPSAVISSKDMTEENRFILSSSTSTESTDSTQMEKKNASAKGKELKKIKKEENKEKEKKQENGFEQPP